MSTQAKEGMRRRDTEMDDSRPAGKGLPARTIRVPTQRQLLDITVLMGGPSTEREVSLVSGSAVADALQSVGHKVHRADIMPGDTSALDRPGIDVVFIVLHGSFGESGDVQALCESRGLRYTGSGPRASKLGLDKVASKEVFRMAGLDTPKWVVLEKDAAGDRQARQLEAVAGPVVVKPVDGGSSVDVTIARDQATRDQAVQTVLAKYGKALVERFVEGRELTVGILGETALPVIEIVPNHAFYDYDAKYADDAGTRYVFDHGLPEAVVRRVQDAALAAYHALGCRDLSRVDFILDGNGAPQALEINTIPGFTSHSLLPKAAARVGISFDQLVDRIAMMAMQR